MVEGGKFAPLGKRGMFTSRQGYGVSNYFNVANDETLLIVLIEDIVAVGNLDEILSVDQIDVFFVAPSDLATSMGNIGELGHPEVQTTIKDTLKRIRDAGRNSGTLVDDNDVREYVELGVKFLLTNVGSWIEAGASEFIQAAENT